MPRDLRWGANGRGTGDRVDHFAQTCFRCTCDVVCRELVIVSCLWGCSALDRTIHCRKSGSTCRSEGARGVLLDVLGGERGAGRGQVEAIDCKLHTVVVVALYPERGISAQFSLACFFISFHGCMGQGMTGTRNRK